MNKSLILICLLISLIGLQLIECKPKWTKEKQTTETTTKLSLTTTDDESDDEESVNENSSEENSSEESDEDDEEDDKKSKKGDDDEKDVSLKQLKKIVNKLKRSQKSEKKKFSKKLDMLKKENKKQWKKIDSLSKRLSSLDGINETLNSSETEWSSSKEKKHHKHHHKHHHHHHNPKNNETATLSCLKKRDTKKTELFKNVKFNNSYAEFSEVSSSKKCWKKCAADSNCVASSFNVNDKSAHKKRGKRDEIDINDAEEHKDDDSNDEEKDIVSNCFLYNCDLDVEESWLKNGNNKDWESYSMLTKDDLIQLQHEQSSDRLAKKAIQEDHNNEFTKFE